jgi:type IV fimbrial biogenesis protein FimT
MREFYRTTTIPLSKTGGFTLVELAITLAVASVLLMLAAPDLRAFRARNQVTAASNSIVAGLNLARFTAVTSADDVTICGSADGSTCASGAWDGGWIVFRDDDEDGVPAASEVIRTVSLVGDLSDTSDVDSIAFEPDGTTTFTTARTIETCFGDASVTNQCKQITLSPYGVVSTTVTTTSSG